MLRIKTPDGTVIEIVGSRVGYRGPMGLWTYVKRGARDAFTFFGGWPAVIPVALVPPVGLALHSLFGNPQAVSDERFIWVIYGLASTGLIFAAILAYNIAAAPFRIERERRIAAESRAAPAQSEFPDWPIYKLLWALAPHLPKDDPADNRWTHVLDDVRNKLSLGALPATAVARHPDAPEDWIDRSYWKTVPLSRKAIDPVAWEIGITDSRSPSIPWLSHIKVRKADASKIWADLDKRLPFDTTVIDAQKLLVARGIDEEKAVRIIQNAAALKFITLFARPAESGGRGGPNSHKALPADIFETCHLWIPPSVATLNDQSFIKPKDGGSALYYDVRVLIEPLIEVAAADYLRLGEINQPPSSSRKD